MIPHPSLALNDAHNGLTMILANNGIRFPVTYPTACLDDGGPIIDPRNYFNQKNLNSKNVTAISAIHRLIYKAQHSALA